VRMTKSRRAPQPPRDRARGEQGAGARPISPPPPRPPLPAIERTDGRLSFAGLGETGRTILVAVDQDNLGRA